MWTDHNFWPKIKICFQIEWRKGENWLQFRQFDWVDFNDKHASIREPNMHASISFILLRCVYLVNRSSCLLLPNLNSKDKCRKLFVCHSSFVINLSWVRQLISSSAVWSAWRWLTSPRTAESSPTTAWRYFLTPILVSLCSRFKCWPSTWGRASRRERRTEGWFTTDTTWTICSRCQMTWS